MDFTGVGFGTPASRVDHLHVLHRVAVVALSLVAGVGLVAAPAAARALDESTAPARSGATPTGAPPAPARVPARDCGPEPATGAAWEALFDGLSGSWGGGDGAASVRLRDGRMLWLFGDTFTGTVRPDGSRGTDARLVRNSIVVTDGSCADVLPTTADALPGRDGTWLWPAAATVVGGSAGGTELVVTAQRLRRTGSGAWGFERVGTATARITVPRFGDPVVGPVTDLPADDVLWGAGLVTEGATTWVYGTREVHEPLVFGRDLLLARAPTATLDDPATWDYRTTAGWSDARAEAVVVRPARLGVSTVPSAARVGSSYVIVTKAEEFLDDDVVALHASRPWGPWREQVLLSAPSRGSVVQYSPAVVAGATPAHAVVVVSRTSTSTARIASDVEVARPTFADVRLR